MRWRPSGRIAAVALVAVLLLLAARPVLSAWPMHVIDNTLRGADGVRLGDANNDGRLDIVTGWEEGGRTRVYFNPGFAKSKDPWPLVDVGETASVEDAVFIDLDADGRLDVVSSCEGETKKMYVHWNTGADKIMRSTAWRQEVIPASDGAMRWMFAEPIELKAGIVSFIAGGKNSNAALGLFQKARAGRDIDALSWQKLVATGWIMSIRALDMDGDGDEDILYSDRKGDEAGVYWLENGSDGEIWTRHLIGGKGREVMFLTRKDVDGDGRSEILAAVKPKSVAIFEQIDEQRMNWSARELSYPEKSGTAKAVEVADVNLDGEMEIIVTCEHAKAPLSGVLAMDLTGENVIDISGPEGIKFDRMELLDLDGDGDLDILTCEERQNNRGLGVIWYENPAR